MKDNIEFHGLINDKRLFITKSFCQLKRLASRYANNDYNPIDNMRVTIYDISKGYNVEILNYKRFNKIIPNNTIKRGKWK